MTTSEEPGTPRADAQPAGLASRLGARIVDFLFLGVAMLLTQLLARSVAGRGAWFVLIPIGELPLFAGPVYEVTTTALWGQTVGKWWLRIRVVRYLGPSQRPGWGRSLVRWGVPALFSLPILVSRRDPYMVYLCLGLQAVVVYGWILRSPERRGLHDLAAGTIVVQRDA